MARAAAAPTAVWLLPPYDPLVDVTNRELLLTDKERRQQLWRAVANPGPVLLAGDVIGTWRRRQQVITVCAFKPFSTAQQRMVQAAAVHAASDEIEVRFTQHATGTDRHDRRLGRPVLRQHRRPPPGARGGPG